MEQQRNKVTGMSSNSSSSRSDIALRNSNISGSGSLHSTAFSRNDLQPEMSNLIGEFRYIRERHIHEISADSVTCPNEDCNARVQRESLLEHITRHSIDEHSPNRLQIVEDRSTPEETVEESGSEIDVGITETVLQEQSARIKELQQVNLELENKIKAQDIIIKKQAEEIAKLRTMNTPSTSNINLTPTSDANIVLSEKYNFTISSKTLNEIARTSTTHTQMGRQLAKALLQKPDEWWINASLKNKKGKNQIDPEVIKCVTDYVIDYGSQSACPWEKGNRSEDKLRKAIRKSIGDIRNDCKQRSRNLQRPRVSNKSSSSDEDIDEEPNTPEPQNGSGSGFRRYILRKR